MIIVHVSFSVEDWIADTMLSDKWKYMYIYYIYLAKIHNLTTVRRQIVTNEYKSVRLGTDPEGGVQGAHAHPFFAKFF